MAEPTVTVPAPEGATLEEALRRWCSPEAVSEIERLAAGGYDGPNVWALGAPETEYERQVDRYRELRACVEAELVDKLRRGYLVATGYGPHAPPDAEPVVIQPDRWRWLVPDLQRSEARAGDLLVTGILVHEGPPATPCKPKRTGGKVAIARLRAWYREWVRSNLDLARIPTPQEDWTEAKKALGDGVPRDSVRKARAELAPDAWKRRGRRRSAGKSAG